jgi:hypothetical protein
VDSSEVDNSVRHTQTNTISTDMKKSSIKTNNDHSHQSRENADEMPKMEESEIQLVESCKRCVWNNPVRSSKRPDLFAPLS